MWIYPYRIAVGSCLGLLFLGSIDVGADTISFDRGNVVVRTISPIIFDAFLEFDVIPIVPRVTSLIDAGSRARSP